MGFRIREVMTGTHEFQDGREPAGSQPFRFRVTWGPERVLDWANPLSDRFLWQELEGEVLAGGLCDWTPCRGTLELQYFSRGRIRYCFDFRVDEVTYHYVGEKVHIRPWNLLFSHTTCFGTLTELESGKLVSTSLVHFKAQHLPQFLATLRWA